MDNIIALREEFRRRGWYKKATGRILLELLWHVILSLGGIVIFIASDNLVIRALGILISTLGSLGVSTNTHTSSHYAASEKIWLDKLLTYFGYPLFLGGSATYWWHKHVVVHHPSPNVIGVDDDVDLQPWFALTEQEVQQSSGIRRLYYKFQWLLIPLVLAGNGFNTQVTGWRYLIRILRDRSQRKRAHWIDLGMLTLHWALCVFLPMAFFPVTSVLGFHFLRFALIGYGMFAVFAPAHFPVEAVFVQKDEGKPDFFSLQTATTVNFRTGFIGRLLCSGVEYQIEHHLFPGISHVYYPKMSRLVEEFCKRHGYSYNTLGWGEGIWKSFLVFYQPKRVEPRLKAFQPTPSSPKVSYLTPISEEGL